MKSFISDVMQSAGCVAAAMLLASCQTTPLTPAAEFVGDMVVSTDYAQFFRLGPQQAGGADRSLRTNDRVMLLRKEFGYSRVQLEDNQVGYMANEDIRPAPPEPKAPTSRRKKSWSGANQGGGEQYYEDIPVTDPNLNIRPEDIPLEPLPELLPEPAGTPETAPAPAPTPAPAPVKETTPESAPPAETSPPVSTST